MSQKKTIFEQLLYLAQWKGMSRAQAVASIGQWLERIGMGEYRDKKLNILSKGNPQNIQFAATLIHDPDIIILDEPFSGPDPVNSILLKTIVKKQISRGKVVLFSSHQMNYIEAFCEKGEQILSLPVSHTVGTIHGAQTADVIEESETDRILSGLLYTSPVLLLLLLDISPVTFSLILLFCILGFLLYQFLLSALRGSMVSKSEAINLSSLPIVLLIIFSFVGVIFPLRSGTLDSLLMRMRSYIPFTSPMVMLARTAMGVVCASIISVWILTLSVMGIAIVSGKVYRFGTLLYGTKPKLPTFLQVMRKT